MFFRLLYLHRQIILIISIFTLAPSSAYENLKLQQAFDNAHIVTLNFYKLFLSCVSSAMPNQQFITDNIQNFINYPAKTTIGLAPKFTGNRKFFANMLGTAAFKEMLEQDDELLRQDTIKKLKYCEEAVMDKELLKDFYDREPEH